MTTNSYHNSSDSKTKYHIPVLIGILLLATILRFYLATDKSLWIDEINRIEWAKGCESQVLSGQKTRELCVRKLPVDLSQAIKVIQNHNPPLTLTLFNMYLRSTGATSDFALRFPFICIGILVVWCAYLLGQELGGGQIGLYLAGLVAISPFHIEYSQEVNHYALGSLLVTLSFLFYFRSLRKEKLPDVAAYVVVSVLGLFTHYYLLILLMCQGLGVLIHYRSRLRTLPRAVVPFILILALFSLYIPVIREQLHEMTSFGGEYGGISYLFDGMTINLLSPYLDQYSYYLPVFFRFNLVIAIFIIFILGLRLDCCSKWKGILALNAIIPFIVLSIAYFVTKENTFLWRRYYLFFTLPFFIPMAFLMGQSKTVIIRMVAILIIGGMFCAGLFHYYHIFKKREWHQAATIIDEHAQETDAIVLLLHHNNAQPLAHYLEKDFRFYGFEPGDEIVSQLEKISQAHNAVWGFFVDIREGNEYRAARKILESRFAFRDDFSVFGVRQLSRYHNDVRSTEPAKSISGFGEAITLSDHKPLYNLDIFGDVADPLAKETITVQRDSRIILKGWAVDALAECAAKGVDVLIDDVPYPTKYGISRPDVAAHFKVPDYENSGFSLLISKDKLEAGKHHFAVRVLSKDGKTYCQGVNFVFDIR